MNIAENSVPSFSRQPLDDTERLTMMSRKTGWDAEFNQMDAGPVDGTYELARLGSLRIARPRINRRIIGHGAPPKDTVALLVPLAACGKSRMQGQALERGSMAVMHDGSEAIWSIEKNNQWAGLVIPTEDLRVPLELESSHSLDHLVARVSIMDAPGHTLNRLCQIMDFAFSVARDGSGDIGTRRSVAEIRENLVSFVSLAMTEPVESAPRRIFQRWQVFRQCQDYIESNLAAPLGMETLARLAKVSVRTLRYSFQQTVGMNPLEFIKMRRLIAAKLGLECTCQEDSTVSAVAMGAGFSHMSYFSRDYYAMFGEYPSTTLQRPPTMH